LGRRQTEPEGQVVAEGVRAAGVVSDEPIGRLRPGTPSPIRSRYSDATSAVVSSSKIPGPQVPTRQSPHPCRRCTLAVGQLRYPMPVGGSSAFGAATMAGVVAGTRQGSACGRPLTRGHACPTCTTGPRASRMASKPGGLASPRDPPALWVRRQRWRAPGEPVNAAKAHRWQAVVRRRLPTARANTTCRRPEARVMGAVPA
jgi:hypothetical protein